MDRLYFEDFPPGEVVEYGDMEVSAVRIKAFAEQFDPQPFHLDENAARDSMAGGLIASGWHTAAMLMRMNIEMQPETVVYRRIHATNYQRTHKHQRHEYLRAVKDLLDRRRGILG